ncbi:nucleoside-diphosphate kinase [Paenibacillus xanthanilyticus]|uniref:Nucleoside diphosphate kinase n=1 Tax=Paenibacillus xanthanilyticus TaxID=1783531 RepID=A0ABV8K3V0_9BACL
MERTFLMIKPDGVQRGLIGKVIQRFEEKGLQLVAAKLVQITMAQAAAHYEEHRDKPFFGELLEYITSGPSFAMIWAGEEIIQVTRAINGKTNPVEAAPGTIRGDYALRKGVNVIHGSDCLESAEKEIANFFTHEELACFLYPADPKEGMTTTPSF